MQRPPKWYRVLFCVPDIEILVKAVNEEEAKQKAWAKIGRESPSVRLEVDSVEELPEAEEDETSDYSKRRTEDDVN